MVKIVIRQLDDFDWQLVNSIKILARRNLGRSPAISEWVIPVIIIYGRVFIAQNTGDQSIVGVCELLRSFQNKFTAFIHSFYIDIPYRDKGTGKKLLREVIKILKADRIKYVELTVDPGNTAAMSFYRGFDFREVSVRKNEYGRGIDRILMRLKF